MKMGLFRNRLLFVFVIIFLICGLTEPGYSFAATDSGRADRIYGQDRYQTAVRIAEKLNSGPVQSVIIASGLNFPDALSGSVLGVKYNAPILLVGNSPADCEDTMAYIRKNLDKNGTIYILGGTGVISAEFQNGLTELGFKNIIRLGGGNRYESSALIAAQCDVPNGTPVTLAFGENFPDALSISGFSANKGWPVLLSGTNELPADVRQLIAEKSPSHIYIAGGTGVISEQVKRDLQTLAPAATIERFGGQDRFETSALINSYFAPNPTQIYLSSGLNYPDALTGSVLAGKNGFPVVLIDPDSATVPAVMEKYLKARLNITAFKATALGGAQVVPEHLVGQALSGVKRQAAFTPASVSKKGFSIASVPSSPGTLQFSASVAPGIKSVFLIIKKGGNEEMVKANVTGGKVVKNIYPRLGPGNYEISIYETSSPDESNPGNAAKRETFNIYYSGTDGSYDQSTANSVVDIDIPTYDDIKSAWIRIIKTDGDTRGAMDDCYVPVDGRIAHQLQLRFGPGTYRIEVYESSDNAGYQPGPSFTVSNTDARNMTYLGRSSWVQSDVPEVIQLAQQITSGLTDDLAKSKAIHDWVASNITYSDRSPAASSALALKHKQANSGSYAALTAALHRAVGLQAKVVPGYTIGSGSDPKTWEEFDQQTSDAREKYWNEILIGGKWINVDTLWDSGTLDENMVFTPQLDDRYFNLSDEEFAKTHRKLVLPEGVKTIPW